MARQGFRVEVDGLAQLRRDLKQIDRSLPRELTKRTRAVAKPVLATARELAPKSDISRPGYQHFAGSLRISTARGGIAIRSTRSGAGIINYGGRHPLFGNRDRWYAQAGTFVLQRAGDRHAHQLERDLAQAVERLMRSAGFSVHH